ncbi:MAG TPA: hypothetical protein VGR00_08220 [Thermoanaerobaculia bacterium]|jgi:hypothetical protein|nr:hypothetical protein [Thermoanaerobaculia bacterium]
MRSSLTLRKSDRMIRERAGERRADVAGLLLVLLGSLFGAAVPARAEDETAPPPLPNRLASSVAEAQKLVERVRGLPFRGPVASDLLPEAKLTAVLEKKLLEDLPTSFEAYTATLSALGLVEPSPDLKGRILRLYARQVAGFYDPAEKKFYVVPERSKEASGVSGLSVELSSLVEEALLAHELTHALQDMRLDLDRRMKALKESSDALLALQAFLEGEATVVMTEALLERLPPEARAAMSPDTLGQLVTSLSAAGSGDLEGAEGVPEFFIKELIFPYASGTAYIQAKRKGSPGWSAIDALYRHPPETTTEILHPDRPAWTRERLKEKDVPKAADVPKGAKLLYRDVLGEWIIATLLDRAGAGDAARTIAAERRDDAILFWEEGSERRVGFLWRIRCSTAAAAQKLSDALEPLYGSRIASRRPSRHVEGDVVTIRLDLPPTVVPAT